MVYIRSFLKYPGNKFSILPNLLSIIKEYSPDVLVEPFMGSCVVSLNAIRSGIVQHAYLNDVNQSVVEMMQMVKDAPYEFIIGYKSLTVDDSLTGNHSPMRGTHGLEMCTIATTIYCSVVVCCSITCYKTASMVL